jgi:hypothetical protein
MYRFQYDGRLQRSLETGTYVLALSFIRISPDQITAVMLMESFDRLSRKEKYAWDVNDLPSSI